MDENTEMLGISAIVDIDHLVSEEGPVQRREREGEQCDGDMTQWIQECLVVARQTWPLGFFVSGRVWKQLRVSAARGVWAELQGCRTVMY